jgi:DNA-binding NtrC family response regulator
LTKTTLAKYLGQVFYKLSKDAIEELQKIRWTGNIREFRNVIERLIILCDKEIKGKDVIAFAAPISK